MGAFNTGFDTVNLHRPTLVPGNSIVALGFASSSSSLKCLTLVALFFP